MGEELHLLLRFSTYFSVSVITVIIIGVMSQNTFLKQYISSVFYYIITVFFYFPGPSPPPIQISTLSLNKPERPTKMIFRDEGLSGSRMCESVS